MVSIKVPSYMIGNEDHIDSQDLSYGIIALECGTSIEILIKKAMSLAPVAFRELFDTNGDIKKNIVIVYNNELIGKDMIGSIKTKENDEIELMIQFAGG
jgi:hypothetical protein